MKLIITYWLFNYLILLGFLDYIQAFKAMIILIPIISGPTYCLYHITKRSDVWTNKN
jgi:hypothetical protein